MGKKTERLCSIIISRHTVSVKSGAPAVRAEEMSAMEDILSGEEAKAEESNIVPAEASAAEVDEGTG